MFKGKRKIVFIVLCAIILVVLSSLFTYFFIVPRFKVTTFNGVVQKEFNKELDVEEVCYGNIFECDNIQPEIKGEYDLNTIGTYEVEYIFRYKNKTYKTNGVLNVVDKVAPEFEKSEEDLIVCPNDGKIIGGSLKATDTYDGDLTESIEYTFDRDNSKLTATVSDLSGNKNTNTYDVTIKDEAGPVITITGDTSISIKNGTSYTDQGATAVDNCDGNVEVTTEGSVNTSKNGTYTITYRARDSQGNTSEATRTVKVYTSSSGTSYSCEGKVKYSCGGSGKIIYLTFDDGPSSNTSKLLDVLKQYNVKATFFVTGNGSDAMIKREYDEGHTVALHSQTHSYGTIYASVDAYFNDLQQISDRVERITGHKSYIVRFPGGSSNTVSRKSKCIMTTLAHELENRGYVYYDWNVSSGDAGATTSTDQVYHNVVDRLGNGRYVVLQHDSKSYSVNAVERIIQYGLDHGYTFARLEKDSMTCHHATAN